MSVSTAEFDVEADAGWDMLDPERDPFENEICEDFAEDVDDTDWEAERRYLLRITAPIVADNGRFL